MSVGDDGTDPNEVDLEALRWTQLTERGALSTEQERQREAWIAADIKHKGAFIRAQAQTEEFNSNSQGVTYVDCGDQYG